MNNKHGLNPDSSTQTKLSGITYDEKAVAARFLLGGIGTGNISLDQRGGFTDFEIFNNPKKGFRSPYTFFAVRTKDENGNSVVKALEAQEQPPFTHSHGFHAWEIGGLPRFRHSEMCGQYPFVQVKLSDSSVPVSVTMECFTPFIPLNTDDSSLPGTIIRYKVRNLSGQTQEVSIAGSFANLCNYSGQDIFTKPLFNGESLNQYVEEESCRGIHFSTGNKTENDLDYMDMAFMTTEDSPTYLEYWNEGAWWDGLQDFWNDFADDGVLTNGLVLSAKGNRMHRSDIKVGSLCVKKEIPAKEEAVFEFILTWYHPNRVRSWDQLNTQRPLIRNYYAKFGPSLRTASYIANHITRLESDSRAFQKALFSSSYPDYVLDAIASNITVIRSTTCFRVEDGSFFAYEGCFDNAGCCDGNCTHVWNYAQTLAFLFPELERSMRRTEFLTETDETGCMVFRARKYFHDPEWEFPPAADGQMGCIIRLYRDWKFSGDDAFLRELWPKAKLALEFAFSNWDSDGDGVLDSQQHNTYDIEFYGLNSMVNSIYFTALRAGEEICSYLGDTETQRKYQFVREKAAEILDASTFNGEYYQQKIEDANEYKYQFGSGCLADQLFGQELAHINGLGYVLDREHVKTALHSIFFYNFKEDMQNHCNLQRTYALNDESGLLLCTWPHGGRPLLPFVYSDEVWTGVEYQVASHLIYEGFIDEGLQIVKAVRDRQNGVKRSPWDEVECGHHYARSLSSYGLLLSLSGYHCDMVNRKLYFKPLIHRESFTTFFSCGSAWGLYHMREDPESGELSSSVDVLYGSLDGIEIISE